MKALRTISRSLVVLTLTVLAVLATGCATGAEVAEQSTKLNTTLREVKVPAYYCAPKDLALAEAYLDFADLESSYGDMLSAGYQLEKAQTHTEAAAAVKDQKGCCPDRDGDRICDAADKCPDDPEDFDNDEDDDGCPEYDRDNDGIKDQFDRCPDQPEDKDGFLDEDGCPEADNDNDRIDDAKDKCPNQAEDRDGFEDTDGCPDVDNDGDGIVDFPARDDKCPDKPETFNGLDDTDGCPDELPPPPPEPKKYDTIEVENDKIVFKKQIQFAVNKATIVGDVSMKILEECTAALKEKSEVRVQVEGHTDSTGNPKKNKKLSQDRANSVVAALVERGIGRSRLVPIGFGPSRPLDPAKNKAAYEKNRRVEFNFLPPDKP